MWHAGYWGPHVGFYGGINYGFGYTGVGFAGGFWRGGVYNYNRSVTNINTTVIHNTYNTTVINNNTTVNRTSFNGGTGGTTAQPNAQERAAEREQHTPMTAAQTQHVQEAGKNRALLASANGGHPAIAATQKPGVFHGPGAVGGAPRHCQRTGRSSAERQNQHDCERTRERGLCKRQAKFWSREPNAKRTGRVSHKRTAWKLTSSEHGEAATIAPKPPGGIAEPSGRWSPRRKTRPLVNSVKP